MDLSGANESLSPCRRRRRRSSPLLLLLLRANDYQLKEQIGWRHWMSDELGPVPGNQTDPQTRLGRPTSLLNTRLPERIKIFAIILRERPSPSRLVWSRPDAVLQLHRAATITTTSALG